VNSHCFAGVRTVIEKSVMDHLKYLGVEWIRSMFIDDVIASHSDSVVDVAAMAMTMKYNATHGTGMVVQVRAPSLSSLSQPGSFL
jgi:hypothetical protein